MKYERGEIKSANFKMFQLQKNVIGEIKSTYFKMFQMHKILKWGYQVSIFEDVSVK